MLAAIISLLEIPIQPQPRPGPIQIDLGGGGGGPNREQYDIIDYIEVLNEFREVVGEQPMARAVRRTKHLQDGLARRKASRENTPSERDLAAALMLGATLEHARAADEAREVATATALRETATLAELERITFELHAARAATRAAQAERGAGGMSGGGAVALLLLGVGVGFMISRR